MERMGPKYLECFQQGKKQFFPQDSCFLFFILVKCTFLNQFQITVNNWKLPGRNIELNTTGMPLSINMVLEMMTGKNKIELML